MSLWLALAAMTALAAALVAWPLLRPPAALSGRRDYDLRVYRAQLEELARERERGLLGEREAAAARLEVERRMLAADAASGRRGGERPQPGARAARWAIVALAALLLLAGGLYAPFGRPDLPSAPFAGRADEPRLAEGQARAPAPSVESLIARLEERVALQPDDLEAWQRLGQAYELTARYDDAVRARRAALALDEGADSHAALGEALVMANGGMVTPAAGQAFERALALDAADPRARFYGGLALLQAGDRQGALDAWAALIEASPADAPWLPELQRRSAALAADLGLEADLPAPGPAAPGPTREQMQAAESMAPEDRAAMIQDMVAGLAARLQEQPGDLEGWRRLGRSYQALGEPDKAAEAWRQVALALPDDLAAQLDYADALVAASRDELSPAALEQMRRVLALDPQNPMALFHLGHAAARAGDADAARDHWQRLIAQVPEEAPERAQIQRLLDQLPPG